MSQFTWSSTDSSCLNKLVVSCSSSVSGFTGPPLLSHLRACFLKRDGLNSVNTSKLVSVNQNYWQFLLNITLEIVLIKRIYFSKMLTERSAREGGKKYRYVLYIHNCKMRYYDIFLGTSPSRQLHVQSK